MSCSRDSGCKIIAERTYPSLKDEINSEFETISSDVMDVLNELSGLVIPDDYLGSRVKDRLNKIGANLSNDAMKVKSAKSDVNTFIDARINEHTIHYQEWEAEQERLRLERAELEKRKMERNKNKNIYLSEN